jgi:hypothetical protein
MSTTPSLNLSGELETNRRMLPLRIMQQETDFSCGGACARMLLEFYGMLGARTEEEISLLLRTRFCHPHPGTHPDRMVEFLRSEGLNVTAGEEGTLGMTYDAIDSGNPVLVLDSTWGGHWRLVIGYEMRGGADDWQRTNLLLADPEFRMEVPTIDRRTGTTVQNARQFLKQWYENRLFDRSWERFYILAHL